MALSGRCRYRWNVHRFRHPERSDGSAPDVESALDARSARGRKSSTASARWSRRYGIRPRDISYFTHGTTVGVNTVIQRKGARLGLSHDGRLRGRARGRPPQDAGPLRSVFAAGRTAVPPASASAAFAERTLSDGSDRHAPSTRQVCETPCQRPTPTAPRRYHSRRPAACLRQSRPTSGASPRSFGHRAPDLPVTLSADVWPVIREYERTVTATVAGYVQAPRRPLSHRRCKPHCARPASRPSR